MAGFYRFIFLFLGGINPFTIITGQAINQPADWPDTAWRLDTIAHTGTNAMDIEANPLTDPNFAYDDDDTGNCSHNEIAAESPVIDLTPAASAGEYYIIVSGQYVYNNIWEYEKLALQYWDADNSQWVDFYVFPLEDTPQAPPDNYCSGTPVDYNAVLNIQNFTTTQLSGFKYRFYYSDNVNGDNGWGWGFCFASPTLHSASVLPPQFELAALPDCDNDQFSVQIIIIDLGGSSSVTVTDDQGSDPQQVSATDTIIMGPYPEGTKVTLTVTSDDEPYVSSVSYIIYHCPPPNDNCINAEPVEILVDPSACTEPIEANTLVASSSDSLNGNLSCTDFSTNDVWYSFEAPSDGNVVVSIDSVWSIPVYFALYENCTDTIEIRCKTVYNPGIWRWDSLVPGQSYLLRVGSIGSSFTRFCMFDNPPVINDHCDNALEISCGDRVRGSTLFALPDTIGSYTGLNENAPDVWYKIIGTGEKIILSTCSRYEIAGYADYDTKIDVYSGSCDSLVHVAGNDDYSHCNFRSVVEFFSEDSTVYFIRVYGYSSTSEGNFTLAVGCEPGCETFAENDNCEGALPIAYNTVIEADNTCQHDALDNPSCDPFGTISDLWYEITTPSSVNGFSLKAFVEDTVQPASGLHSALYESCGDTEISCRELPENQTISITNLDTSHTYKLQLWSGEKGTFSFVVYPYIPPEIYTEFLTDCDRHEYSVIVSVPDFGGASSVILSVTPDSTQVILDNPGDSITFGPYPEGTQVRIKAENADVPEIHAYNVVRFYCPPPHDYCENAVEIENLPFTHSADATHATNNGGLEVCSSAMNDGVWYKLTVGQESDSLTVRVLPDNWDAEIQVYTGECYNWICVAESDTGTAGEVEVLNFLPEPGTTYYINVGYHQINAAANGGPFTIEITGNAVLHNFFYPKFSFILYPNPAANTVHWKSSAEVEQIRILSLTGKLLLKQNRPEEGTLDIRRLPKGMYWVEVKINGQKGIYKLIKN